MRCRFRSTMAALLLLGPGVTAETQEAGPAARVELVRLDVVVTDTNRRPVRNLTREDFAVLEDGKPQTVKNFLFVGRATTPSPLTSTSESTPTAVPAESEHEPGRYIVIVADDLHMGRESVEGAKEALKRFVDESLAPDDRVAVVATSAPEGTQQLTTDRAVLRQAISHLSSKQAALAAVAQGQALTPAQAELILRGDRTALLLATRQTMDEPTSALGSSSPRATVEAMDGATPAGVEPGDKAAAREVQRQARAVLVDALRFSVTTLRTIDDVVRGLSSLPGRKLCLLVSDGFLVGKGTSEELTRQLRQVTDAATRSGAVVYTLDTSVLGPAGADAGAAGPPAPPGLHEHVTRAAQQESRETLQGLADDTGGLLVRGPSEVDSGLRRMVEDNAAYYVMAYEPVNLKRDGRFRKIEVRLPGRPDLLVRTRRGYFAPDNRKPGAPSAAAAAPHALDEAEARALLAAPIPAGGIPVRLAADYVDLPPAGAQAIVQANVDLAGVRWHEVGGRRQATLELVGGVYDVTGNPVRSPFGRSFDLDLGQNEYRQAREAGLTYQQQLLLEPGRYEVRILVREPGQPPLGGATREIEIPNLARGSLTLSSLFLSSSAAGGGVAQESTEGGETLRTAQVLRRFKPSDTLYFQLYVYNVTPDDKGTADVILQAQVRSGSTLVAASKPQPVTFQQKDGVPLPQSNAVGLQGLAPGKYELRVVVVDRKANATAFRSAEFTVE
jgi:VWFA-related protein